MSFMFKPLAYDDVSAKNKINVDKTVMDAVIFGDNNVVDQILNRVKNNDEKLIVVDGYVSASFERFINIMKTEADNKKMEITFIPMKDVYKSEEALDEMVKESLPLNYEEDPVLLFGKLYEGEMTDFVDDKRLDNLFDTIENNDSTVVVYGTGSSINILRENADQVIYIDVIPKIAAIRAREGKYKNIGTTKEIPFNLLMRRNYFVDFEVVVKLRKELLKNDSIDSYIIDNDNAEFGFVPKQSFNIILSTLVKSPFRAKPVYLEGIWGGEFIRKIRNLPMDIAQKVAWIFEFIPMEVSIVVEAHGKQLDIPFSTFLHKEGESILGQKVLSRFGGYFPIRFNYDDTWHSDGNMSIQVHPGKKFNKEHYNELEGQDEAYYVIATGHDAKTYCGFKKDGKEFLELCKTSEKDGSMIDYQEYIDYVESVPGRQIMIPSGTIHASGRNQFILELGSLTIGSYTYKVYDYNRKDAEGKLRPIHTANAEKVLAWERDAKWVSENIAIEPYLIDQGESYSEWQVGKTDLMYYETRRIDMKTGGRYEGKNNNQFTVLTVVDGEKVRISSKSNPEFYYEANFLDVITIPAHISEYVVEALGYQPVVVHKTILRQD